MSNAIRSGSLKPLRPRGFGYRTFDKSSRATRRLERQTERIRIAFLAGILVVGLGVVSLPGQAETQDAATYTREQATRGQKLFKDSCEACHGKDLEGTAFGPQLAGAALLPKWRNKLDELYRTIRVTMPKFSPGGYTARQNAELVAYILSACGVSSGNIELPSNEDALRRLTAIVPRVRR